MRSNLAYYSNPNAMTLGATAPAEYHNGVVSNDFAYTGSQSIKLTLTSGSTVAGLNVDNFFSLGYAPAVGDEAWYSLRIYVPATINWQATPGWLKWLRFRVSRGGMSETNIRGIYSLLKTAFDMDYVYEGINTQISLNASTNNQPPVGSWVTLEIHTVFDMTSKDLGGLAEFHFYRNGTMVGHITSQANMSFSDDHAHEFSWIDYWNGGAHANQVVYVTDLCEALNVAGHRDDRSSLVSNGAGGLMIGL